MCEIDFEYRPYSLKQTQQTCVDLEFIVIVKFIFYYPPESTLKMFNIHVEYSFNVIMIYIFFCGFRHLSAWDRRWCCNGGETWQYSTKIKYHKIIFFYLYNKVNNILRVNFLLCRAFPQCSFAKYYIFNMYKIKNTRVCLSVIRTSGKQRTVATWYFCAIFKIY